MILLGDCQPFATRALEKLKKKLLQQGNGTCTKRISDKSVRLFCILFFSQEIFFSSSNFKRCDRTRSVGSILKPRPLLEKDIYFLINNQFFLLEAILKISEVSRKKSEG